jgi:hypothetical protein
MTPKSWADLVRTILRANGPLWQVHPRTLYNVATDTFDEIETWFLKEVQSLQRQARIIYEQQVVPTWGDDDLQGFRHALYGFMMNTMALLDRLSCYHTGNQREETGRMERTLATWCGIKADPAKHLVKMWRHSLMHTGVPLRMRNPTTGMEYSWLIHWNEEMSRDQHMEFHYGQLQHRVTILNTSLFLLIEDLKTGTEKLFDSARKDAKKKVAIEAVHRKIQDVLFS